MQMQTEREAEEASARSQFAVSRVLRVACTVYEGGQCALNDEPPIAHRAPCSCLLWWLLFEL